MWMKVRNTFIIFLVSGFWHGANWTFIAWGFVNALFIMPSIVFNTNRSNIETVAQGKILPSVKEFFQIGITFFMAAFCWIFFRAKDLTSAIDYIRGIFSMSVFQVPDINFSPALWLIIPFMMMEWLGRERQYAISHMGLQWPTPIRWVFYYLIVFAIFYFAGSEQQFIYFQF